MDLQQDIRHSSQFFPPLRVGEVHVWRVDLKRESSAVERASESLSMEEKQKADRYHFSKDRSHFIKTRDILRKILADYTGVAPREIRFSYNRYGKPMLDGMNGEICFNLSHSLNVALIAVTRRRKIGVDLEFIKSDFPIMKTAENFFSTREMTMFNSVSRDLQTAAFYNGWTRKEAYLKAVGKGFSFSPKDFSVSLVSENAEVLTDNFRQNWTLLTLPFEPGYKAALAAEGAIGSIRLRYWSEN